MRLLLLLALVLPTFATAQSAYIPKHTQSYDLLNRYRVLYDIDTDYLPSTQNIWRQDATRLARTVRPLASSAVSQANIAYLLRDSPEYALATTSSTSSLSSHKHFVDSSQQFYALESRRDSTTYGGTASGDGIFGLFYKDPATAYSYKTNGLSIHANPMLLLSGGYSADEGTNVFQNTRGLALRGLIDDKIYFYTSILENQRGFLNFQNERILNYEAIPSNGLFKRFASGVLDNMRGYDYLNATAYIGVPISKHVNIEFGHGSHFLGNGYRSLLLSDNAQNYLYLKLQTRVGHFQLQNIFGELAALSRKAVGASDQLLPKKYFAAHYLTYRPSRRFEVSLFENIVFSREDHFEFQYLNPVILYRAVEHLVGSEDNIMIGFNARWDLWRRISLYGQVLLDEFKLNELRAGDGWWANKYGLQAGVQYFDAFGVDHLDLQLEANLVRPFTYGHRDALEARPEYSTASYSHYNQAMAHPLGANFREVVGLLRYQPTGSLVLRGKAILAQYGASSARGGNILVLNTLRDGDYGYEVADGDRQEILTLDGTITYMFAHNYCIDLQAIYRNQDRASGFLETRYVGLGLRVNVANVPFDY